MEVGVGPKRIDNETAAAPSAEADGLMDTVGVVCVDRDAQVCAAVSSGGLSLKSCGRVGAAAVYGAGCWAQVG